MNRFSLHAYASLLVIGGIGSLYFLSLCVGAPFIVCVVAVVAMIGGLAVYWRKHSSSLAGAAMQPRDAKILLIGLVVGTLAAVALSRKYGDWDAVYIWNLHAQALTHPGHWKLLFRYGNFGHADYPMLMPGINAFLLRLTGEGGRHAVPVFLSVFSTLLIPAWMYLRLCSSHRGIAGAALILFLSNTFYLNIGFLQCADVWLSLFVLALVFAFEDYKRTGDRRCLLVAGTMIGCMAWTKNEGIMLGAIAVVFFAREIFQRHAFLPLAVGLALPLACLCIFKLGYAPANDLLSDRDSLAFSKLADKERYRMITASFFDAWAKRFPLMGMLVFPYAVACVLLERWPHRNFLFVATALAGYGCIYLLTPHDLEWHLATSAERLVLHLVPLIVYTLARDTVTMLPPRRNVDERRAEST